MIFYLLTVAVLHSVVRCSIVLHSSVVGCRLSVAGCRLPVTSYPFFIQLFVVQLFFIHLLPVAGCRLPVVGCQLSVTGYQLPVMSCGFSVVRIDATFAPKIQ